MKSNVVPDSVSGKFANIGLVCACLVVLIHSPRGAMIGSAQWWWSALVQDGICQMAVPFFFLASGFFLAGHMDEDGWWKRESVKRIRTLLVPFLVWNALHLTCGFAIRLCSGTPPVTVRSWVRFLGTVFGGCLLPSVPVGALWFIRSLMVLVLVAPILKRLASPLGLCVLFVLYGVLNPYPYEGRNWMHEFFSLGYVSFCGMAWFTLGLWMRRTDAMARFADRLAGRWMWALMLGGGGYDS